MWGRSIGDRGTGWTARAGNGSARVVLAVRAGDSPGYSLVLRIVLNESDETLRLIDGKRLGLRRDADDYGRGGDGYGDGRGRRLGGISDRGGGEDDGSGRGHLRGRGIGYGGTGSAGGCGERTACARIALGKGPRDALALGIVCDGSRKDLRLRQLKRYGCRGSSHGSGGLRRRGCRGISGWGRGMGAGV